jgi:hypothetical protein
VNNNHHISPPRVIIVARFNMHTGIVEKKCTGINMHTGVVTQKCTDINIHTGALKPNCTGNFFSKPVNKCTGKFIYSCTVHKQHHNQTPTKMRWSDKFFNKKTERSCDIFHQRLEHLHWRLLCRSPPGCPLIYQTFTVHHCRGKAFDNCMTVSWESIGTWINLEIK